MHELAVCEALLGQVASIARANNITMVTSVTVRVGPLSGIEPGLLQEAFTIARTTTVARDAELVVETDPVRIRCGHCERTEEVSPNRLRCTACGRVCSELVSGDALTLTNIAVERPEKNQSGTRSL